LSLDLGVLGVLYCPARAHNYGTRGAVHQLLSIILKLRIIVLLPVC
jgi:hypothetical protein